MFVVSLSKGRGAEIDAYSEFVFVRSYFQLQEAVGGSREVHHFDNLKPLDQRKHHVVNKKVIVACSLQRVGCFASVLVVDSAPSGCNAADVRPGKGVLEFLEGGKLGGIGVKVGGDDLNGVGVQESLLGYNLDHRVGAFARILVETPPPSIRKVQKQQVGCQAQGHKGTCRISPF